MIGDKTQPQKLLEEIIPADLPRNESEKYPSDPEPLGKGETKFPTIQEQNEYWQAKEKAAEPKPPRKWSLARRRKFNATLAKKKALEQEAKESPKVQERIEAWHRVTPQLEEEALIRFCPCCGRNIERFLA